MMKGRAQFFNKIGCSKKKVSHLTQTKKEILVFYNEGHISIQLDCPSVRHMDVVGKSS